eukprot:11875932-Ditylum_brightwellii.AAC.1
MHPNVNTQIGNVPLHLIARRKKGVRIQDVLPVDQCKKQYKKEKQDRSKFWDFGVQNAKGVKGTIQSCVICVLEEQNMIKTDISVLAKSDTSKEKLATDDYIRLPKTCRRHTLPKEEKTAGRLPRVVKN